MVNGENRFRYANSMEYLSGVRCYISLVCHVLSYFFDRNYTIERIVNKNIMREGLINYEIFGRDGIVNATRMEIL